MREVKQGISICSRCGRRIAAAKTLVIDDLPVCLKCMYGETKPFSLYPIGVVKNDLKRNKKGFGTTGKRGLSRIELIPSQRPFLHKLEEEKDITIIYYLHESSHVVSVFNRGLDGKRVGVFASRTPYRLSRLAIQSVTLVKIEDTTLYVQGLDAIDGSPVIDIKMKWDALR